MTRLWSDWQSLFHKYVEGFGLSENPSISSEGWQTFFNTLKSLNLPLALEKLNLAKNNINDAGVSSMVNILASTSSLSQLYLGNNHSITSIGWMTLSTILRHPNTSLTDLSLLANRRVDDDVAICFANAL